MLYLCIWWTNRKTNRKKSVKRIIDNSQKERVETLERKSRPVRVHKPSVFYIERSVIKIDR